MIKELFIYDRDESLFKEILKQSKTIEGRYHVSPNYGHDLNTANLEAFLKDPIKGLTSPAQKYPIAVCLTPQSRMIKINGQKWEHFTFSLFFLTTAGTENNQIKRIDRDTNQSKQHVWYDWNDMKQCAVDFLEILKQVIKTRQATATVPLRAIMNLEDEKAVISRQTRVQNDRLNGVGISFFLQVFTDACELKDYSKTVITDINIPALEGFGGAAQ